MKARRGFILALCLLVGVTSITFGAVRGWRYHQQQKDRAFEQAILLSEVASAGVYARVLLLIESD